MLNLPKTTELRKQLPKSAIFSKFQLTNTKKEKVDNDISRLFIVNELSSGKINLEKGKDIEAIYVVNVILKNKSYNDQSIVLIAKTIPQKIVFALEYENEISIAAYHSKLIKTVWQDKEDAILQIKGLNLDELWKNFVIQIGDIEVEQGNTLDEQIEIDEKRQRIEKEIERLEKQARNELQPKKKFELVQKIKKLKGNEFIE